MSRWERLHTFSVAGCSVLSTVLCSASCELCKTLNWFWFIILYRTERQKPEYCLFSSFQGHTEAVRCLRFSPDGKWVASAADDHTVKVIYCDTLLMCLRHMGMLGLSFYQALPALTHKHPSFIRQLAEPCGFAETTFLMGIVSDGPQHP